MKRSDLPAHIAQVVDEAQEHLTEYQRNTNAGTYGAIAWIPITAALTLVDPVAFFLLPLAWVWQIGFYAVSMPHFREYLHLTEEACDLVREDRELLLNGPSVREIYKGFEEHRND